MNWAEENRQLLATKGHYPMQMTAKPRLWWFNLAQGKMSSLANASQGRFCIVLIGDKKGRDDYYVIPYSVAKNLLTEGTLAKPAEKRPAPRWNMYIRRGRLGLWPDESSSDNQVPEIDVEQYHGRHACMQRWSRGNG